MNEKEISAEDWLIVEKRLESMPENMSIGFLSHSFTRDQLMVQIKDKTEIGTAYALMQLEFIAWLLEQSRIV